MIAKRAARRKDSKSSFAALAKYIMREEKGGEIDFTRVTNCGFDTPDLAVKEIESTQARNTRSKADKTYHLVLSFPAGEKPTDEQIEDIEKEICKAIGLGDHQRISAGHSDTDNFHIHIAINKIHPISHLAIEPYYDKYSLDEACARLELKHGLKRDNRIDKNKSRDNVPGRAGDMEAHSGVDSFKRWAVDQKEELQKGLQQSQSWDDLHQELAKFDMEIKPRGAGMVIGAKNESAFIKASDLGKAFSKANLEKALGPYKAPAKDLSPVVQRKTYIKRPQQPAGESSTLWDTYQKARHTLIADKRQILAQLKQQRAREVDRLKQDYAVRKEAIRKDSVLKGKIKRDVYKQLSKNHRERGAEAFARHKQAVQQVHEQYQVRGWQEWLVDQASAGNDQALAMLRANSRKPAKGAEPFAFAGNAVGAILTPLRPAVQANGDLIYTVKGARIRDTGNRLRLDADAGGDLAAAIRLAREKYGDHLSVEGDERFKRAVVEAAVSSGQSVTFADPGMEKRRQVLQELEDGKKARQPEPDHKTNKLETEIQEWINSRNETRKRTYDIMELRRFGESDAGQAKYQGTRRISESISVGLYEKSGVILVAPLTERQAERFRQQPVGSLVTLNKKGHVHFQRQERGHGR